MDRLLLFATVLVFLHVLEPGSARAQDAGAKAAADAGPKIDPAVAEEIKYADGLNSLGLSYYADLVLANIKGEDGGRKVISEIKSKVGIKKFDEANALIAKQPNQDSQAVWAMKLTVADGYYGWGMYSNAQSLYEGFFKKYSDGPPDTLNDFYTKSGYKYAQMMLLLGQDKGALEAFRATLKAKTMERAFKRQIQTEMAELMVKIGAKAPGDEQKALFEEAKKLCGDIMWVQDVWFGKAIVIGAHIQMLQGDIEGAQKTVDDAWDQLKAIDDMLRQDAKEYGDDILKISPMAECHYMLGVIMQDEADKLIAANGEKDKIIALLLGKVTGKDSKTGKDKRTTGALKHLMTVFIDYPSTSWGPDAGVRGRKIQETLKQRMGLDVNVAIPEEKRRKIEQIQFSEARTLFNQQQWADAVEAYLRVLKLFPEDETAMGALSEVATCYLELQEDLFRDAVVHHLAERFGGDSPQMAAAGDQVLRMAALYNDRKMAEKRDETYALYFSHFPKHSRMAAILYSFGLQRITAEDYPGGLEYFKKVQSTYTNSTSYLDSLNRIAVCYDKMGDHTNEVKTLADYVQRLEKEGTGASVIMGKYRLAIALRQLGPKYTATALNRFAELVKLLSDPKNPYQRTPEEKETASKILEGSMFYKSLCYAALTQPEDKLADYRQSAIDGFTALAKTYPKSPYAPPALLQAATMWTIMKNPEKAQELFRKLQMDYASSAEAKNADYLYAKSLLDLGRRNEAVPVFKRMFEQAGGKYTEVQILTSGDELFKSKEYDIAHQAFSKLLETTKDAKFKELVLMKDGQALVEMGNEEEAVKTLETLFKLYPRSAYTVDGSFYLSRAYTDLGAKETDEQRRSDDFNKAVKAMNKASTYEKSPVGLLKIDLAVARMWLMRAKAEDQFRGQKGKDYKERALGGYQSIILLNSPEKPDLRALIEDAYNESIPLFVEQQKWSDVTENCDKYLATFPQGRYLADVRKWRNKARMNTEGTGQKAPEEGETPAPAKEAATPSTNPTPPAATAPVAAPATPVKAPVATPSTKAPAKAPAPVGSK